MNIQCKLTYASIENMFCFFFLPLFIYLFIYFCQWLATDRWFSSGTLVSSPNNIDRYNIAEILLKVALNPITPYPYTVLHYCIRINQDVFYWCIRQFTLYNDNRQHNNQQKRDKVTNNDLKNTAQKTRSSIMNTTKTCVEIRYSRMVGSPCFTSGTVVLL
jgi:hypothetical protein